ncbi:MAG: GIY-YIG nuclease family protein [Acidimicrobiales bacterium]
MGERLAWYPSLRPGCSASPPGTASVEAHELALRLRDFEGALTPDELLRRGRSDLDGPGLYSWWVDEEGADDLSRGLGHTVAPGLIYAGLAGATRSRSERRSTNTLWGRLQGMHLGSRSDFSTFRRSLGSIMAELRGTNEIDEAHLSEWMHAHLRVLTVPVEDADALDGLESGVLAELDPPLNLAEMPKSEVRARLSQLRKLHGK